MDIYVVRAFFGWCTIINMVMLGFSFLVYLLLGDWSYQMNNKVFSISRGTFNTMFCGFIGLYKIFVLAFNLVPYIALAIVSG